MKKLFLTIVTFSILFIIGCQENSITDPITVEPTNKVDPIPPNPQYAVTLNLTFSAELTYLCTVCGENNEETTAGFISSQSSDTVTLTENNSYILEKSYLIQGREDGMVIMFRFLVTTEDINLTEVFLVLPEIES